MAAHAPRSIAGAALAAQGRSRVRPDATVESYLGAWLSHIKARVRARTHVGYEALISLHAIPHLGAIALEKLLDDYVQSITTGAPLTIKAGKRIIREVLKPDSGIDMELCRRLILDCFESEDYIEGRRAFMEKRKPQFKGK